MNIVKGSCARTRRFVDRFRRQEGFVLPWAISVALVGVFVAVPVAVLAGVSFLNQSKVEDSLRNYYAADALVHGFAEDLKRGADANPLAPFTYAPTSRGFR